MTLKFDYSRKMAAFALEKAKEIKNIHKVYSQANKMPTLIATNGLAPTLTFMASKKEYEETLQAIIDWFTEKSIYGLESGNSPEDFINKVLSLNSSMYRTITNEAIQFFGWFRRFVTALKG